MSPPPHDALTPVYSLHQLSAPRKRFSVPQARIIVGGGCYTRWHSANSLSFFQISAGPYRLEHSLAQPQSSGLAYGTRVRPPDRNMLASHRQQWPRLRLCLC